MGYLSHLDRSQASFLPLPINRFEPSPEMPRRDGLFLPNSIIHFHPITEYSSSA